MTGGTHALAAVAAVLAVDQLLNLSSHAPGPEPAGLVLVLGVAVVGGWLPDIDSDMSQIRQATGTTTRTILGRVFGWGIRAATGGHRGATHSLLALAAMVALVLVLPVWLGWPLALGYASHLLADQITPAGLPLLWPLPDRVRLPRPLTIRTGSMFEYLFAVGLGILIWSIWQ